MSLFKIYRGNSNDFPANYPLHEGYAYFFEDTGELKIDTATARKTVNASRLVNVDNVGNVEYIDFEDILTINDNIDVEHGGTGANTLTVNAILIGNGTNTIKAVKPANGSVIVGDSTNGVKGVSGTGALYAATSGVPQFGTLPLSSGGTGAKTAAGARTNLDVYSKLETDDKVNAVTTASYPVTLTASGWTQNGSWYTQSYNNSAITCGKNGDVPLICTYTSNVDEYSNIDHAEATPGTGVTFYIQNKPTNDIGIILIDTK